MSDRPRFSDVPVTRITPTINNISVSQTSDNNIIKV